MEEQKNKTPVIMEFTIASITQGIEYWLNEVVLKENIVVDKVTWDSQNHTFLINLTNGIQVGQKL